MLHQAAGRRRQHKQKQRERYSADHLEADLAEHGEEAAAVDPDGIGVGQKPAHGGGQLGPHGAGERHQDERCAGDDEPGVDLLALCRSSPASARNMKNIGICEIGVWRSSPTKDRWQRRRPAT
jgi:hypothetical protein